MIVIIKEKGQIQEFGSNGFTKQTILIETNDQYPQILPVDFLKENIKLLENFQVNDTIKIEFNIKSNECNGKYYLNLVAWKVEKC